MSNVSIAMTGNDCAQITFSSMQQNDHLTVGNDTQHVINITDGDFLRRIAGDLFKLKNMNFIGNVAVKLGDSVRINIDQTLWHDLADVLLAFTFNIDISNFLIDQVAL